MTKGKNRLKSSIVFKMTKGPNYKYIHNAQYIFYICILIFKKKEHFSFNAPNV